MGHNIKNAKNGYSASNAKMAEFEAPGIKE